MDVSNCETNFPHKLLLTNSQVTNLKSESKEEKGAFLSMLLGTVVASILGNTLASKGVIRAGEGTARVGYRSKRSSFS